MALQGLFNEVNAQKARGGDMNKWAIDARREKLAAESLAASVASKTEAPSRTAHVAVFSTAESRAREAREREAAWAATFGVGGRCMSRDGREGTVLYIGPIDHDPKPEMQRIWMGVQWDDAARGKHDGSAKGKRYFTTTDGLASGSFAKPRALTLVVIEEEVLDDDAPEIGAVTEAAAEGPSAVAQSASDVAMALFSGMM